jgi:site-specific DNA-methyltransferase (adenine-specific)
MAKNAKKFIGDMNNRMKCEIYRDNFQNRKCYNIPKAQLVIADIPYIIGNNFYGSSPMWYAGGDNKNNESKLAGKAAFNSDFNFNLYEYFHFCSKMLKKEPKKADIRGRSSDAPCMIIFYSFEQIQTLINAAAKHRFVHYIPLIFIKNYSPQVLKANMHVIGATEYALVFYRDKLPKFRNGAQTDENRKTIRGTKKMIFNWFQWKKDGKDIPKIHPAQKPISVLKRLIEIFTDPRDVVIDPCCGNGSTLRAAMELGRSAYGFEIDRNFYSRAKNEMLVFENYSQMSIGDFI